MKFVVTTLVTVLLALSQVICSCPAQAAPAMQDMASAASHAHQMPSSDADTNCAEDVDHCPVTRAVVSSSDQATKFSDTRVSVDYAPDAAISGKTAVGLAEARAEPEVFNRRSRLTSQTPVTLKIRFLN